MSVHSENSDWDYFDMRDDSSCYRDDDYYNTTDDDGPNDSDDYASTTRLVSPPAAPAHWASVAQPARLATAAMPSPFTRSRIPIRQPTPSPRIPFDIIRRLIAILSAQHQGRTLALLSRCNRELYHLVTPILLRHVGRTKDELVRLARMLTSIPVAPPLTYLSPPPGARPAAPPASAFTRAVKHVELHDPQSLALATSFYRRGYESFYSWTPYPPSKTELKRRSRAAREAYARGLPVIEVRTPVAIVPTLRFKPITLSLRPDVVEAVTLGGRYLFRHTHISLRDCNLGMFDRVKVLCLHYPLAQDDYVHWGAVSRLEDPRVEGIERVAADKLIPDSSSTLVLHRMGGANIPSHPAASFLVGFVKQGEKLPSLGLHGLMRSRSLDELIHYRAEQIVRHIKACLGVPDLVPNTRGTQPQAHSGVGPTPTPARTITTHRTFTYIDPLNIHWPSASNGLKSLTGKAHQVALQRLDSRVHAGLGALALTITVNIIGEHGRAQAAVCKACGERAEMRPMNAHREKTRRHFEARADHKAEIVKPAERVHAVRNATPRWGWRRPRRA